MPTKRTRGTCPHPSPYTSTVPVYASHPTIRKEQEVPVGCKDGAGPGQMSPSVCGCLRRGSQPLQWPSLAQHLLQAAGEVRSSLCTWSHSTMRTCLWLWPVLTRQGFVLGVAEEEVKTGQGQVGCIDGNAYLWRSGSCRWPSERRDQLPARGLRRRFPG
jgi:hypothetical protein